MLMPKLVRITTMPISLQLLLKGQMRFMRSQGFDVTMISSDGPEVSAVVEQEGCDHIAVTLTRAITPLQDLKALIKLTRILRKIKPDIVHTHTPKAGLIGLWAAWFAGVPIRLHTIAGLPWVERTGMMRLLLKTIEKITAQAATQVMPNSFVQRDFMLREGIAVHKMKVLGFGSSNGIDTTHFSHTPAIEQAAQQLCVDAKLPALGKVWIFVGRIVRDKGIGELMDAFDRHHQVYPDDQLWLVGEEEPQLDPLDEQHAQWLRHHPGIRWWGFQQDIRPYLAASFALVFPSYREGFPNVPLQSGSMGCVLILSDINGCNEIVQHEEDGLLVPVKNSQAIQEAMSFIRNQTEKAELFKHRIRQKIMDRYDQQTSWQLLLVEYQTWLHQRN
jgi:glycosyltransferase involved in cell wall biosynthesis